MQAPSGYKPFDPGGIRVNRDHGHDLKQDLLRWRRHRARRDASRRAAGLVVSTGSSRRAKRDRPLKLAKAALASFDTTKLHTFDKRIDIRARKATGEKNDWPRDP